MSAISDRRILWILYPVGETNSLLPRDRIFHGQTNRKSRRVLRGCDPSDPASEFIATAVNDGPEAVTTINVHGATNSSISPGAFENNAPTQPDSNIIFPSGENEIVFETDQSYEFGDSPVDALGVKITYYFGDGSQKAVDVMVFGDDDTSK